MSWDDLELPDGWKVGTIGDVAKVIGGGTPKTAVPGNFSETEGHPWLTPADLTGYTEKYIRRGRRFLTNQGLATSSATYLPAGAVLFSSRAPIGYVAIAEVPVTTNQGFRSFVPSDEIDPEYLYYALKFLRPEAEQMASGTTFAEISGSKVARLPFVYPRLEEQRQIVAALDNATSKSSSAASHLEVARRAIERFRQAVLAAASSGDLTAEWREGNPDVEPAQPLIERSRAALATRARARRLPDNATVPDWLEIPETWEWAPLASLAEIKGGIQKQPKRAPKKNAYPYLRVANVLRGRLELSEIHKFELFDDELESYRLLPGDLLIVEGNGSLTEIGRSAIWNGAIENCVHQNHIIRVRCVEADAAFIDLVWNSPVGAREIAELAVTSSGLYSLSAGKIGAFAIPVPPQEEQREIVRRATALLEHADTQLARIDAAARRVKQTSQAILAKAFRGELLSGQDDGVERQVAFETVR